MKKTGIYIKQCLNPGYLIFNGFELSKQMFVYSLAQWSQSP